MSPRPSLDTHMQTPFLLAVVATANSLGATLSQPFSTRTNPKWSFTSLLVALSLAYLFVTVCHAQPARAVETPDVLYKADFTVNRKVYHLFVENAPSTIKDFKYRVRIDYLSASALPTVPPVASAPPVAPVAPVAPVPPVAPVLTTSWVNKEGFIEASYYLVDLKDIEAFVNLAIGALQPIANAAAASPPTHGLQAADAPFEAATVATSTVKEEFRKELRKMFQEILVTRLILTDAPVAGTVILHKTVYPELEVSNAELLTVLEEITRRRTTAKQGRAGTLADVSPITNPKKGESPSYSKQAIKALKREAIQNTDVRLDREVMIKAEVDSLENRGYTVKNKIVSVKQGVFTTDHIELSVKDGNVLYIRVHGQYKKGG
jgi:hypothetical protein